MDNHRINLERLVLVTMCTLVLASKMEDRESQTPKLNDVGAMVNQKFHLKQWNELERLILVYFEFRLVIPTATSFFDYFIEAIAVETEYLSARFCSFFTMKRELADLALDYLDLTLANRYMVQETPSKIAAACMAAARSSLEMNEVWPMRLADMTEWSMDKIDVWVQQLQVARNQSNKLVASDIKFQTPTFRTVGTFETPESGYVSHDGKEIVGNSREHESNLNVPAAGGGGGTLTQQDEVYDDLDENLELDSSYSEDEDED